jgi:hypothetical protein
MGGLTMFVGILHLSNLLPKYHNVVITIFNGAFDASSGVFYLFEVSSLVNYKLHLTMKRYYSSLVFQEGRDSWLTHSFRCFL